jgi:hypothetical protein
LRASFKVSVAQEPDTRLGAGERSTLSLATPDASHSALAHTSAFAERVSAHTFSEVVERNTMFLRTECSLLFSVDRQYEHGALASAGATQVRGISARGEYTDIHLSRTGDHASRERHF